jgi:hypothetical protein
MARGIKSSYGDRTEFHEGRQVSREAFMRGSSPQARAAPWPFGPQPGGASTTKITPARYPKPGYIHTERFPGFSSSLGRIQSAGPIRLSRRMRERRE